MKTPRRRLLFASALTAMGCAAQPKHQAFLGVGLPALAGTVSLRVEVALPPSRSLQQVARRWQPEDVKLLRVKLLRDDGAGYVDTGLSQDLDRKVAPIATGASFVNMAAGKKYRASVEAWGEAGGANAAALLNANSPSTADFDFTVTPGQDLGASRSATVNLQLDAVAFSGTARVEVNGKPGATNSVEAQLWVQGGGSPVATQALGSNVGTAVFGGLRAGPDYEVKLKAKDASEGVLAEIASTAFRFDPAAASLEQTLAFGLNFPGAASPTPSPSPSPSPSPTPGNFVVGLGVSGFANAFDSAGNQWMVNNTQARVFKLDSAGSLLGSFPVGFVPTGLRFDALGNTWVSSGNGNSVAKLNSAGSVLSAFSLGQNGFLAIASNGDVWVPNNNSSNGTSVVKANSAGSVLGTFTVGKAPAMVVVDAHSNAWVSNNAATGGGTVTKLNSAGSVLGTFTVGARPWGMAVDPSGNLWVALQGAAQVAKLNSAGSLLGTFSVGTNPVLLTIDASGNLWVGGSYVSKFSNSGSLLATYSAGGPSFGVAISPTGEVWVARGAPGSTFVRLLLTP